MFLDTLLLNSGHQFMHCTVLLCVQYNLKSCCLFSGWFAKDANVTIVYDITITMTSQWEMGTLQVLQARKWCHVLARAGRAKRCPIQKDRSVSTGRTAPCGRARQEDSRFLAIQCLVCATSRSWCRSRLSCTRSEMHIKTLTFTISGHGMRCW